MNKITNELINSADVAYKNFHSKLIPTVVGDTVLGVRAPVCRQIAKKYAHAPEGEAFLSELPHRYYDENIVHGYMLGFLKDDNLEKRLAEFMPYMDNWAVVDMTVSCLKGFFKNPDASLDFVRTCIASDKEYIVRFGIVSLLNYYLTEKHASLAISLVIDIKREEFYIKMAQAWFLATALTKHYELALPIFEACSLDVWVHNKAIQKARESYRISNDKKDYLNSLKIKRAGR